MGICCVYMRGKNGFLTVSGWGMWASSSRYTIRIGYAYLQRPQLAPGLRKTENKSPPQCNR